MNTLPQRRPLCGVILVFSCIAACAFNAVFAQQSAAVRTWNDSSGSYSIEATATDFADGKVTLLTPDGREAIVPVSRLCAEDQRYVHSTFVGAGAEVDSTIDGLDEIKNVRELRRMVNDYRTADAAVLAYNAYLARDDLENKDRELAEGELREWTTRAAGQLVRLGNDWLSPDEIARIRQEELRLIKEAHRLIDVNSDELARERFEEASDVNEEAVRADFYLGTLHALVGASPNYAEKNFRECVRRLEKQPDRLLGSRRSNYVAALNNLALTEVRLKRFDQAIEHWTTALAVSPRTPELVQNLGRMTQLGAMRFGVSKRAGRDAGDLYARACVANNSAQYDTSVAWLYMPFTDSMDGSMETSGDEELHPVSHATCFAVGPELVLAPANAVSDATRFNVRSFGAGKQPNPYGEIVALDSDSGMVIIRFRGLNANPLPVSPDEVALGRDYQVLGTTTPGHGGESLNARPTTVVAYDSSPAWQGFLYSAALAMQSEGAISLDQGLVLRAEHSVAPRRFALHNKVLEAGYIGAPLIDEEGRVVAVHIGSPNEVIGVASTLSGALASSEFYTWITTVDGVAKRPAPQAQQPNELAGMGAANDGFHQSVFQLIGYKNAPRLKWSHRIAKLHELKNQGAWTSFEDRTCMVCSGTGQVPCPNRKCRNGSVRTYQQRVIRGPDGSVGGGMQVVVPKKCPTCDGDDRVKCPHCSGSKIDPMFK